MILSIKRAVLFSFAVALLASCATGEMASAPPPPMGQSPNGHVAFFFLGGMQYREHREAYGEFVYSYEGSKDSLLSEGYSYSYHSKLPIEVDNGDLKLTLGRENLTEAAGVVLIKSRGRFRVIYGIYKPEDILKTASEYFRRRP